MNTRLLVKPLLLISLCMAYGCQMPTQQQMGTGVRTCSDYNSPGCGGRVAGISIGQGLNGLIGNAIGRAPDCGDDRAAYGAFLKATQAPLGESVYWRNGRSGHWGFYCPLRDGHTRSIGDYCRDLASTAYVDGKMQRTRGTVCRQPNGEWYPAN